MTRIAAALAALAVAVVLVPSAAAFGFTDESLLPPHGTVGVPYSFTLHARNGCPPYAYHQNPGGQLPPGLSLRSDGLISGTPIIAGSFGFWAAVTNQCPGDSSERYITITIDPSRALALTVPAAVVGEVGRPLSLALSASGGAAPYAWSLAAGTLPRDVGFDPASGILQGVPADAGTTALTFQVVDRKGAVATHDVQIQIAVKLGIATGGLQRARLGKPYRTQLVARGGVGAATWSLLRGHLPVGLRLDRKTGTIAGVARGAGSFRVSVAVSDSLGAKSSRVFRLSVGR